MAATIPFPKRDNGAEILPMKSAVADSRTDVPWEGEHCGVETLSLESGALVLVSDTSAKPRIVLGSDHAGFSVKETIRKYLESAGYAVSDLGTSSEESVDYPDYGKAVGERVVSKRADLGIAVCGSGIGISIAANKVPGIRAALAHDVNTARLAREHNDANVLALGGRIVTGEAAIEMVQVFLTTAYLGGRHQRRLDKITAIEKERRGTTAKGSS